MRYSKKTNTSTYGIATRLIFEDMERCTEGILRVMMYEASTTRFNAIYDL